MKKLFLILFFVSFAFAADSTAVFHSDTMNPGLSDYDASIADVTRFKLFDNTEHTSDTIAAGDYLILGPFPLSMDKGEPQFRYFNLVGEGIGSADTAAYGFQITHSNSITDTSSRWVQFDSTDAASGPAQTVVDISQKSGKFIWYRVWNITASAINMYSEQYVFFRRAWASD